MLTFCERDSLLFPHCACMPYWPQQYVSGPAALHWAGGSVLLHVPVLLGMPFVINWPWEEYLPHSRSGWKICLTLTIIVKILSFAVSFYHLLDYHNTELKCCLKSIQEELKVMPGTPASPSQCMICIWITSLLIQFLANLHPGRKKILVQILTFSHPCERPEQGSCSLL